MKKLVLLIVILVLISGGWYLFNNKASRDIADMPADIVDTTAKLPDPIENSIVIDSFKDASTLVADLVDVTGGDSFGTSRILRKDELLTHAITATLPKPSGTNKYEGWLVRKEPTLMFVSTGILQLNENGDYYLEYVTDEALIDYDFVVVTEETIVDATPEVHIIEGLAK